LISSGWICIKYSVVVVVFVVVVVVVSLSVVVALLRVMLGQMSYKATKAGLALSVVYLSMFYCIVVYQVPFLCIVSFCWYV